MVKVIAYSHGNPVRVDRGTHALPIFKAPIFRHTRDEAGMEATAHHCTVSGWTESECYNEADKETRVLCTGLDFDWTEIDHGTWKEHELTMFGVRALVSDFTGRVQWTLSAQVNGHTAVFARNDLSPTVRKAKAVAAESLMRYLPAADGVE